MMSLPCNMETHSLLPLSNIAATPEPAAYATANLCHAPTTHSFELSTELHELAEACLSDPLASLDQSTASSAPPCRKRRAISDLAQEFSEFDGTDELNLDAHDGLRQLIYGDPLQALNDSYAINPSLFSAPHKCSDLEDVLNLLWMKDETESTTQSASSPLTSSDHISLISDLDWDYGTNESSSNQGESNDIPSSDNLQSWEVHDEGVIEPSSNKGHTPDLIFNWQSLQKEEATQASEFRVHSQQHRKVEAARAEWVQGETRASWQEKKQRVPRLSWMDEIRASWQPKKEGGRGSWQPEGEMRASWQQAQEGGCRKQERVELGAASASTEKRSVDACGASLKSPRSAGAWAGPTLLDIESALALNSAGSPPNTAMSPLSSNFSPIAFPTPSSNPKQTLSSFFDVKKLLSDDPTKGTWDHDSLDSSWRWKLQKRNSLEPKYTVKVESEEKALGDGYRWRKYGQKSIKNSPFPRSYYRCSSGKCNAKKQVEKCEENAGIFLVTYEGIHLHHRPNPLHKFHTLGDLNEEEKEKSSSHLCSPSSSTSCSYSIHPICGSSSSYTLLT